MALKNILSKNRVVLIVYLLLVALYFGRNYIGCQGRIWFDITKTLPVLFLGVATLIARADKFISCALILSAAGDLAGEEHQFLWQIGLFAMAHIAYIVSFARRRDISRTSIAASILWSFVMLLFGGYVVSHIESSVIKIACSIYILIIGTMAITTFNIKSPYRWAYILAALLFVFSDSSIAINKFVCRFNGASVTIMSTYLTAQAIFAMLTLKGRCATSCRQ